MLKREFTTLLQVKGNVIPLVIALISILCCFGRSLEAERRTIIMGGENGISWQEGGGVIKAVRQISPTQVEQSNTPGNVLDFDANGRLGWLSPQQADETKNISLGMLSRGGGLNAPTIFSQEIKNSLLFMVDDDPTTAFERKTLRGGTQVNSLGVIMDFDLGARFGVERIQFFPRNAHPDFLDSDFPFQNDYLRGFELFLNDGSEETQVANQPVLTTAKLEPQNEAAVVDLKIPPQYVRYIRLKSQTTVGFEIAEFRIFGSGFVPRADYLSDIFDFGSELALWGRIRWEEEYFGTKRLSRLQVSSRSGWDDTPLEYTRIDEASGSDIPWRKGAVVSTASGEQLNLDTFGDIQESLDIFNSLPFEERSDAALTLDEYTSLGSEKGIVRDDLVAWSRWSPPYNLGDITVSAGNIEDEEIGVSILSPGPRRYFQLRVKFSSEELGSARAIGALAFSISNPPLAEQLLSEIMPRKVELGLPAAFTYAVLPTSLRLGIDQGFDMFEIATPVRCEAIEAIEVLHADGRLETADFTGANLNQLPIQDATGKFAIEAVEERFFRVRFPIIEESNLQANKAALIKIHFKCRVLRFGTTFRGTAWNSGADTQGQQVIGGNAADLGPGDDDLIPLGVADPKDLAVQVPLAGDKLLANVVIKPRPFTPNGDGANDITTISYDLTRLVGVAPLSIKVFDLAGQVVCPLFDGQQGGGSFSVEWNGNDAEGNKVPPGIYLFHIDLDTDAKNEAVVGIVEMVY